MKAANIKLLYKSHSNLKFINKNPFHKTMPSLHKRFCFKKWGTKVSFLQQKIPVSVSSNPEVKNSMIVREFLWLKEKLELCWQLYTSKSRDRFNFTLEGILLEKNKAKYLFCGCVVNLQIPLFAPPQTLQHHKSPCGEI